MHDDFEDFDELLFVDEILVEAELFNRPQNEQLLVDLQIQPNILKHLDYFVIVQRCLMMFLLLEIECPMPGHPKWHRLIMLEQPSADFKVHPKVFRMRLHIRLGFLRLRLLLSFSTFLNVISCQLSHRYIELVLLNVHLGNGFHNFTLELCHCHFNDQLIHESKLDQHFIPCVHIESIQIDELFAGDWQRLVLRVLAQGVVLICLFLYFGQDLGQSAVCLQLQVLHNKIIMTQSLTQQIKRGHRKINRYWKIIGCQVGLIFYNLSIKILIMNNFRYDKLNFVLHLQNQKSHYRKLIEAKKNIDFKSLEQNTQQCASPTHKYEMFKDRQRKQNNAKLVNKISEINKKNGLLQNMDQEAKKRQLSLKNYNTPGIKYEEQKIVQDNLKLVERISTIKPMVGSNDEWKDHFKKFKGLERRIQKYGKQKVYDPEIYLRETLSSLERPGKKQSQRISRLSNHEVPQSKGEVDHDQNLNTLNQLRFAAVHTAKPKKSRKRKLKKLQSNRLTNKTVPQISKLQAESFKMQINKIILKDDKSEEKTENHCELSRSRTNTGQ